MEFTKICCLDAMNEDHLNISVLFIAGRLFPRVFSAFSVYSDCLVTGNAVKLLHRLMYVWHVIIQFVHIDMIDLHAEFYFCGPYQLYSWIYTFKQ